MKKIVLGSASALALVFAMSGTASAQGLIDIGEIVPELELPAVDDIALLNIGGVLGDSLIDIDALDTTVTGIYANTAVNISPSVATTAVTGTGVDLTAVGPVLQAAAGLAASAPTAAGALALELGDLASLGGNAVATGEISTTAVGQIVNQVNQNATFASTEDLTDIDLTIADSTLDVTSATSNAAANTSNTASAASASALEIAAVIGGTDLVDNSSLTSVDGALQGVYANNLAVNVSPSLASSIVTGVNASVESVSTTAVGQIVTQINSIGLDGATVAGALGE